MNKKQFSKIISLYNEGISTQICVNIILNYPAKNSQETAEAIDEFYRTVVFTDVTKDLRDPKVKAITALLGLGWDKESAIEVIEGKI